MALSLRATESEMHQYAVNWPSLILSKAVLPLKPEFQGKKVAERLSLCKKSEREVAVEVLSETRLQSKFTVLGAQG